MSQKIRGVAPVYRLRSSDDRALLFFCKSLCESKKDVPTINRPDSKNRSCAGNFLE